MEEGKRGGKQHALLKKRRVNPEALRVHLLTSVREEIPAVQVARNEQQEYKQSREEGPRVVGTRSDLSFERFEAKGEESLVNPFDSPEKSPITLAAVGNYCFSATSRTLGDEKMEEARYEDAKPAAVVSSPSRLLTLLHAAQTDDPSSMTMKVTSRQIPMSFIAKAGPVQETVMGRTSDGSVAAAGRERPPAFSRLAEELALIPDEDKHAYLQAIRHMDPSVMKREADFTMFLLVENNQAPQAARRIVEYWKRRSSIFGERAFRPLLDLSGNGALTDEEIHGLRTCTGVELPDDPAGRRVVCFDDDLLPPPFMQLGPRKARCSFYWLNAAAATTPLSQTEGFVLLRVVRYAEFDLQVFLNAATLIGEAMPLKVHSMHFCCIPPKGRRKLFIETFAPVCMQILGKKLASRTSVHIGDEKGSVLSKLIASGLRKDDLPSTLGGNLVCFMCDVGRNEETGESDLSSPSNVGNVTTMTNLAGTVTGAQGASLETQKKATVMVMTESTMTSLTEELKLIPDEEKQDYEEAVKVADPNVLKTEANPAMFLLVENNQAPQAARRIVEYWKHRKGLFGDRAFRPVLDLSGYGALSNEDIRPFEASLKGMMLPNDPAGRKVTYFDDAELPADYMRLGPARARILFYFYSAAAAATSISQIDGVVMLRVIRQVDFDATKALKVPSMMGEVMPLKINSVHFCCIPPKGRRKHFTDRFMPMYLQSSGEKLGSVTKVHVEDKKGSLISKLEACGLKKEGLPTTLGGSWSCDSVETGTKQREHHLKEPASLLNESDDKALAILAEAAQKAILEERKARKRQMDVMSAHQRRQREKGDEKMLQRKCVEITKAHLQLREENARLEKMLADAKAKVALVEFGMSVYFDQSLAPRQSFAVASGATTANSTLHRKRAARGPEVEACPASGLGVKEENFKSAAQTKCTGNVQDPPASAATLPFPQNQRLTQLPITPQPAVVLRTASFLPQKQHWQRRQSRAILGLFQQRMEAKSSARQAATASQQAVRQDLVAVQANALQDTLEAQLQPQSNARSTLDAASRSLTLMETQPVAVSPLDGRQLSALSQLLAPMETQPSATLPIFGQGTAQCFSTASTNPLGRIIPRQTLGSILHSSNRLVVAPQSANALLAASQSALEQLRMSNAGLMSDIASLLLAQSASPNALAQADAVSQELLKSLALAAVSSSSSSNGPSQTGRRSAGPDGGPNNGSPFHGPFGGWQT